jgi:Ca2+-binding EF-hand superfamily protein
MTEAFIVGTVNSIFKQIGEAIKRRFVGSLKEAFEFLDLDKDGKLSRRNLVHGLKQVCNKHKKSQYAQKISS